MLARTLASAAALALAAAPCLAADPTSALDIGERRSSASAGVYLAVPFGGARSGRPQGGLRLRTTHDYRNAGNAAPSRVINSDAFELRLVGEERPTLFVADMPVTGREARRNMVGGPFSLLVIGLAIVGGVVIYSALDGDEEDRCLDPDICD